MELGDEFILEPNEHFNNLLVNTTYSDIQLPTNVYNKGNGLYFLTAGRSVWKLSAVILEARMGIEKEQLTEGGKKKKKQGWKGADQGTAMSVLCCHCDRA